MAESVIRLDLVSYGPGRLRRLRATAPPNYRLGNDRSHNPWRAPQLPPLPGGRELTGRTPTDRNGNPFSPRKRVSLYRQLVSPHADAFPSARSQVQGPQSGR